jgi:Predicted permease.
MAYISSILEGDYKKFIHWLYNSRLAWYNIVELNNWEDTAMKACLFYALRQLLRKPKELVTLIVISVGIMTALLMLALILESNWRSTVLPESADNYHFQLYDLTQSEQKYIKSLPYVIYIKYKYVDDQIGQGQVITCVRVRHDLSATSLKYCREIMDKFDLWSRPHYVNVPYYLILRNMLVNQSYYLLTATPYILFPDTQLILNLFSVFLCSASALILGERYKRCYSEFGTLRALGMTERDIYKLNILQSIAVQFCALPPAAIIVAAFGKIYINAAKSFGTNESAVFTDLMNHIPLINIIYIFIISTIAAGVGAFLVCYSEKNRTPLELLGGVKAAAISYVAKTSDRFSRTSSPRIYNRLHSSRTRFQAMRNIIAVTVILPLPLFFICLYTDMTVNADELLLSTSYVGAISLLLLIVAFMLSLTVSAYFIRGRKREFAILRSLGLSCGKLASFALPDAFLRYIQSGLLAFISMFYIYTKYFFALRYNPDMLSSYTDTIIAMIFPLLIGSAAISLLPGILGAAAALRGSMGRDIINDMREAE